MYLFHKYLSWKKHAPCVFRNIYMSKFILLKTLNGNTCDCSSAIKNNDILESDKIEKLKAEKIIEVAKAILSMEGWTFEAKMNTDVIWSKYFEEYGKLFLFKGVVDCSAEEFFNVYIKIENCSKWNNTVKCAKVLKRIDDCTEFVYLVTDEYMGGLVKCRDFVLVRTWSREGNTIFVGQTAANDDIVKKCDEYIRGQQPVFAYVLTPVDDEPYKCHIQWLQTAKLNGWLPQRLVDQATSGAMLDGMKNFRANIKFDRK